jgi:hypothetical protein
VPFVVRLTLAILLVTASVAGAQPSPLAHARQLYNDRQYDAAIAAATEALKIPALADPAGVVLARAYLDRFDGTAVPDDLVSAREALKRVDTSKLVARDGVELVIALGKSLYLDEQFGASAELFEIAIGRANLLVPGAKDLLLEWWAGALDRQAQLGPESERRPLYERILHRAEDELRADDTSAVAWFWLVAASRGADQLERAWSAAAAGWVRAPALGPRGATLRDDLDRLVTQVIVPERARELASGATGVPADPRPAMSILQGQWEELKRKWGK